MKVLEAALDALRRGERVVLVTVIAADGSAPRSAGARMAVFQDGSTTGTVGGGTFEHLARKEALAALDDGRPRRFSANLRRDAGMICGGSMEAFIDPLLPPPRFYLLGGGHVARALAPLLLPLGFRVTAVDGREEVARPERFPGCEVVHAPPRAFAAELETDRDTYLLVASHSHVLDGQVLAELVRKPWAWLGLLASRNKTATLLGELREAGIPDELLARISAPVGLDLGAETPEEIAVSIAAELVRLRRGATDRPARPLAELRGFVQAGGAR